MWEMLGPYYGKFGSCSRDGKAIRLTYDHKGSDQQEQKRITSVGGFVMNNRVNGKTFDVGVLAVTRSLGDVSMKEFVIGNPYTTEIELCEKDTCLLLACDGVNLFHIDLGCVFGSTSH